MQERPEETLAFIQAFIDGLLHRPASAASTSYPDLRALLAEGEGGSHAIHPGQFPPRRWGAQLSDGRDAGGKEVGMGGE